MIIPCIDLMEGKAVQLIQGSKKALEADYRELISRFKGFTVHVIDLDAAMGKGSNKDIIRDICSELKCRVGGGIRTVGKAREIISLGADKIIVGSQAFSEDGINHDFLDELDKEIGKDRVIVAVDSKQGKIVIKGWKQATGLDVLDAIKELEGYCSGFLYTYVDKEGMMEGTDIGTLEKLRKLTSNEITAAGGISSTEEVRKLEKLNINSALGMALYTGKINLEEIRKLY